MAKDSFYFWEDRHWILYNRRNKEVQLFDARDDNQKDSIGLLNLIKIDPWYLKLPLRDQIKPLKTKKIKKKLRQTLNLPHKRKQQRTHVLVQKAILRIHQHNPHDKTKLK